MIAIVREFEAMVRARKWLSIGAYSYAWSASEGGVLRYPRAGTPEPGAKPRAVLMAPLHDNHHGPPGVRVCKAQGHGTGKGRGHGRGRSKW